ncbi:glycosyl hydrolase family 28-related protein [Actinoplanes sp. NPDC026623]|uniref:glycosyl hydrolase family 28-related protein n=1 Tax=Actinoplanes sp. NPDC026623 TaxID=3155610 RepID=UPI0033CBD1D1
MSFLPEPVDPARHERVRAARRIVAAALLPLIAIPMLATSAQAAEAPAAGGYSLAATVSPAALTVQECAADPNCLVAPAPVADSAANYKALQGLIDAARIRTGLDKDGKVLTGPTPMTVFVPAGEYLINKGLRLPPYVSLRGAGITATVLRADPRIASNWSYSTIVRHNDVKSAGSTQTVSDLTVNGDCRAGAGAPVPADLPASPAEPCDFLSTVPGTNTNTAGGVSVGDGWTVRQVRITNVEYFKLWIHNAKDVQIVDNRFDNWGGAESGDEDNIGGGGRNENVLIEHNQFDRTIRGNGMDFTNAIRPTIRYNTIYTDRAVAAARGMGDYGTIYMEGVPEATIADNLLYGAHIQLQSNGKYDHVGSNKDITNPRASVISGNQIIDSFGPGVTIVYDDYSTPDPAFPTDPNKVVWGTPGTWDTISTEGQNHYLRPGGANVVSGNTIIRPAESGVVVAGLRNQVKTAADTITGNTVVNAGASGSYEYSTGGGTYETSGVVIGIGNGDKIYGNSVADQLDAEHPRHTTWFGVQLGARSAKSTITNTVLTGPNGEANTATGVLGYLNRNGVAVPYAPTGLAVANGTVTWDESYVQAGVPVAGYKVFRDGEQVADLPTGSAVVPGNLLSANAFSLEADVPVNTVYNVVSTTSLGRYAAAGAVGTASLSLKATAAGSIGAAGVDYVPVTPNQQYTTTASYQALAGAFNRARTGIEYYDAAKVRISRLATGNTNSKETADNWITSSFTSAAPANAVYARVFVSVDNTLKDDVHLVDRIGLVAGTNTEQFVTAGAPAGATYHVLAYRQGGEFGSISAVKAP